MRTIQVFHVVSSLDHIGLNRARQPFLLKIGNSGIVSQQSAPLGAIFAGSDKTTITSPK